MLNKHFVKLLLVVSSNADTFVCFLNLPMSYLPPANTLEVNGIYVTFGTLNSSVSFQKQYPGSNMPYIISFAMQLLHNIYTEEYRWFNYMLNAILSTQCLMGLPWEKPIAVHEVMICVIMFLLIPEGTLFPCEIRMYVCLFVVVLCWSVLLSNHYSTLLPERLEQASVVISICAELGYIFAI